MSDDFSSTRPVTQDDVARHAGVSRSIVSYVLNDGPRPVAPETRQRILNAIRELGYRPNRAAQNLTRSKNENIAHKQLGIIMSDVYMLRRPYYADILAGIHNTAHEQEYHIRFIRFFSDLKDPLLFNQLIHREEVSGIILLALDQSIHSDQEWTLIAEMRSRIRNIICLEWELEGLPSVLFNRQEAALMAGRRLVASGLRRLMYVGPEDARLSGFRQLCMEEHLPTHTSPTGDGLVFGFNLSDGYRAALAIAAMAERPEGVLGGTDEVSMGMLRGFAEAGLRVPEDISVVSIDNIEMSEFSIPPLTTVNVNTFEMGHTAVQTLIHRAIHPADVPVHAVLPIQLVERKSCKPVRGGESAGSHS